MAKPQWPSPFKTMSIPLLKQNPKFGRRISIFRKRGTVEVNVTVRPLLGDTVNSHLCVIDGYYVVVELRPGFVAMSAEDAYTFSQVLTAAYTHANRLSEKYKGKYFEPGKSA